MPSGLPNELIDVLASQGYDITAHGDKLADEKFEGRLRWYDWQRHVPGELRLIWQSLSDETRFAVYMTAERSAEHECEQ